MKTEGTWAQDSWKKKKVTKPNDDKENTNPVSSTETENYYIWAKVQLKKQKKKHI